MSSSTETQIAVKSSLLFSPESHKTACFFPSKIIAYTLGIFDRECVKSLFLVRPLKIDLSFRRPPFFFKFQKKKVERFSKLRGFQKSTKIVQKYEVFTPNVENLSSQIKMCSYKKLRGSQIELRATDSKVVEPMSNSNQYSQWKLKDSQVSKMWLQKKVQRLSKFIGGKLSQKFFQSLEVFNYTQNSYWKLGSS